MGTDAPDFAKQFDVFPARGLLAGQDQVEAFPLSHLKGGGVVGCALNRPGAGFEDLAQAFFDLRICAYHERGANREGAHFDICKGTHVGAFRMSRYLKVKTMSHLWQTGRSYSLPEQLSHGIR